MISFITDDRVKLVSELVPVIIGKNTSLPINVLILKDLVIINANNTALFMTNLNINGVTIIFKDDIAFDYRQISENNCYYDTNLEQSMKMMYNSYSGLINIQNNVAIKNNLISSQDESFKPMVGMKAADGCKFYKLLGNNMNKFYMVPFFSGFPLLTKNDDVSISLYKGLEKNTIVVYENIFKKKLNQSVYLMFRTIDLC